jgi:CRISPR type I-D-associated protein Csc1
LASIQGVNLAVLTCHDYLFYASQDYNSSARPSEVIGSYALMYALNRRITRVQRCVSDNVPHYDEDMEHMTTYATAAAHWSAYGPEPRASTQPSLVREGAIGVIQSGGSNLPELEKMTWNSIGESLLDIMKQDNLNVPKTGVYYKLTPPTVFYFYTLGERPSSVIRIGKKLSAARIVTHQLEAAIETGEFRPTCPITVVDLPGETEILEGSIMTVPPTPVLVNSRLRGEHVRATDERGHQHRFPVPRLDRFAAAWSNQEGLHEPTDVSRD